MPVQEQTPYIKYVANGVTQTFSTEFDCESKDQLVVMLNGEEPAFTSWSYADKQVTFVTAPVVDTVVELKRQSKLNRTTDYQSFNHTLNYKALNSDFDRIWYAIQEQNYKAGQYDYDYNFVLTQVRPINTGGTGANNVFNARSNLDVYSKSEVDSLVATGGEGNVVGVAGGGTGAATVAEARTNLGVMSSTEVENAINSATPQSTETALGVAKIATTTIAQAGTNDTDIITAKKLANTRQSVWVNKTGMLFGTTYMNTALYEKEISFLSGLTNGLLLTTKVTFKNLTTNIETIVYFGCVSNWTGGIASSANFTVPPNTSFKIEIVRTDSLSTVVTLAVNQWSEKYYV